MKFTDEQITKCADAGAAAAHGALLEVYDDTDNANALRITKKYKNNWKDDSSGRVSFARAVLETAEQFRESSAPALEWISYEERMPDAADADGSGNVLVLGYGGFCNHRWNQPPPESYWLPGSVLVNLSRRPVPPKPDPVREAFEVSGLDCLPGVEFVWNKDRHEYNSAAARAVFDTFKRGYHAAQAVKA